MSSMGILINKMKNIFSSNKNIENRDIENKLKLNKPPNKEPNEITIKPEVTREVAPEIEGNLSNIFKFTVLASTIYFGKKIYDGYKKNKLKDLRDNFNKIKNSISKKVINNILFNNKKI